MAVSSAKAASHRNEPIRIKMNDESALEVIGRRLRTNSRYKSCSITHDGLRSVLADKQLCELEIASRRRDLAAEEIIFREGGIADDVFVITSGTVKFTKIHPNKQSYIIGLMFPGEIICEPFKPRHTFSAAAATDVELCVIPPDALSHLLKSTPQIERALFRASSIELETRHDWTFLLRGCSSYQRLALFLWLLAMRAQPQSNGTQQNKVVTVQLFLPLSRAEIAGFLDITIETISRQMTLMKKSGIIEVRGTREVTIPNIGLLADHAAIDLTAPL